ncbi:hypothetical protein LUR56_35280 [Streptomyces sp. MT29]|nr:hypothetical protein [Streptomyces sp. MT29]
MLWARGTDGLTRLEDSDGFDAPLGHNWTGSFRFGPDGKDTDEARAVLLLSCGKGSGHGRMMTADATSAGAASTTRRPGSGSSPSSRRRRRPTPGAPAVRLRSAGG